MAEETGRRLLIPTLPHSHGGNITPTRDVYWKTWFHKLSDFFVTPDEFASLQKEKTVEPSFGLGWDGYASVHRYQKTEFSEKIATAEIVILNGYYQSSEYLDRKLVKKYISLPLAITRKLDKIKIGENDIMLHVRRGDYTKIEGTLLPAEYYLTAVDQIILKTPPKKGKIWVFSDDIPWCKKELKFEMPTEYVSGKEDYEELYLMGRFSYAVIANSTFSWWGIYLSDKEPVVIAPVPWMKNQPLDGDEIYLPNMIKQDYQA